MVKACSISRCTCTGKHVSLRGAAYIAPLWEFQQTLCALHLGQRKTNPKSHSSFDPIAALAQPPAEHGGGNPCATPVWGSSGGDGSIPAGSELPRIWEGERPSHTLTSCFPSGAPGSKCIDNDERGRVYPGYREGQSPLLAACAGRAEVTRFAVY